jgi:hypothetical protein
MKFLIQKIENQVRHDFSFNLLESVRFHDWLTNGHDQSIIRYVNCNYGSNGIIEKPIFKKYHRTYVPIGTVEFVTQFLQEFHGLSPNPINVPTSLFSYAHRRIFNGTNMDIEGLEGKWFIKSNDKIKDITKLVKNPDLLCVPPGGNYQISEYINIDSEWRTFIYKGKLVGLQHYVGEFTLFPDIKAIKDMIKVYEASGEAPIAYTLDVGINPTIEIDGSFFNETFVIEVHDFFSCGLYGFSNHAILLSMFSRWFHEYIRKNGTPRTI